jgi:hypothetical protein
MTSWMTWSIGRLNAQTWTPSRRAWPRFLRRFLSLEFEAMIESPLIQEMQAKWTQQAIIAFLEARFQAVPAQLTEDLQRISEEHRLRELIRFAGICPDLSTFQAQLAQLSETGN